MGVVVIAPAVTTDLTVMQRVWDELGLSAGTDQDLLLDMIARASSVIARETRRTFGIETVTETLDGSGSRILGLSRMPIVEVIGVTEDGTAITDYSVEDADAGALYRANGWGRSGGLRMWGTEAYSSGYILPGYQDQRYSATYRAGYALPAESGANLPGAVEQACIETVKAWYFARDTDPAVSSVKVGQLSVSYFDKSPTSPSSLPASALGLLRNYYAGYGAR